MSEVPRAREALLRTGESRREREVVRQAKRMAGLRRLLPAHLPALFAQEDERVVLAFLANPHRPWGKRRDEVAYELYRHYTTRAQAEGVLWTPVLDEMASRNFWPHEKRGQNPRVRSVQEHLSPLRAALAENPPEHEVSAWMSFRAGALTSLLLRHAPFTPTLLEYGRRSGEGLAEILHNPGLPSEVANQLLDESLAILLEEPLAEAASPRARGAVRVLEALRGEGRGEARVTAELLEALLARVERAGEKESRPGPGTLREVLANLLAHLSPLAREEQLLRLYEGAGGRDYQVAAIARATREMSLLRRIWAERREGPRVREAMASHPLASADPEIGPMLARYGGSAEQDLLRYGRGAGFRAMLQRQLGDASLRKQAAEWAWKRLDEVLLWLSPGDLDAGARSQVREVRETSRRIERLLACLKSEPEGTADAVSRLLEEFPRDLLLLLPRLEVERWRALPQSLWTRMLSAPHPEVRLALMAQLAQVGGEFAPEPPPRPRRRRGRAPR